MFSSKPSASSAAVRRAISSASSGTTTSSASTISTHSLRNGRFSSAQFFFFGIGAVEVELHDRRAVLLGDPGGLVGALAVDDEDLVGPGQRGQAAAQVLGLVLDRHEHAHPAPCRARERATSRRGCVQSGLASASERSSARCSAIVGI